MTIPFPKRCIKCFLLEDNCRCEKAMKVTYPKDKFVFRSDERLAQARNN